MTNFINPELLINNIKEILKERKESINNEELLTSVSSLIGTRKKILGEVFFKVANLTSINIDILCEKVFSNTKHELLVDLSKAKTKLHAFMMVHSNSDRKISKLIGISTSRLSRLQSGVIKDIYADEVYALATIFGLKPSQLFNYLFGDGERPIVGLVSDAEVKEEKDG